MKTFLLAFLAALCLSTHAADNHRMTLTDLANHICAQCGMNDTDDVSAAKMFLQRRLEMVWNSQLWRSSLIEATMTINPDGTCTLSNTVWIPSRATLLLPPEFESVLAVRADNHAMNVASLESYYRTDTDWLDMQGDPFEFQILRPAVWEFQTPSPFLSIAGVAADTNVLLNVAYSADGTTRQNVVKNITIQSINLTQGYNTETPTPFDPIFYWSNPALETLPTPIGTALIIYSISKAATQKPVSIITDSSVSVVNVANTGTGADGNYRQTGFTNGRPSYIISPKVLSFGDGVTVPITSGLSDNQNYILFWNGTAWEIDFNDFGIMEPQQLNGDNVATPDLCSSGDWVPQAGGNPALVTAKPSVLIPTEPLVCVPAAAGSYPMRQRLRLTVQPQLSVNLRVLGKTACPILGDYDAAPINNIEPCLMAFARGDMLLRARQNGKAQIAAQEGASLLAALARSEAFQQASNFKIQPEGGFGDDSTFMYPNSMHPL